MSRSQVHTDSDGEGSLNERMTVMVCPTVVTDTASGELVSL